MSRIGQMSTGKKIALVAILPLMLAGWTVTHRSFVWVDVEAEGAPHIVAPVPLVLVQGAALFAPDELELVEAPEVGEYLPHAERIIRALRDGGDGVYVDVTGEGEYVRISKQADELRVRVRDGGQTKVDVTVSFATILSALDAYDEDRGGFDTSDLLGALSSMPRGQVVHVLDGANEVSIRMW